MLAHPGPAPKPDKPLDVGTGAVCASFDLRTAGWLSIGSPHPEVGFVELSNLPAFDEGLRGDPAATRRYRDSMLEPRHAMLSVKVDGVAPELTSDTADPQRPRWYGDAITVEMDAVPDARSLRQAWHIRALPDGVPEVRIRLRGRLDRPTLAEITETDPPSPTGARTRLSSHGNGILVEADALPASASLTVHGCDVSWAIAGGGATGIVRPGQDRCSFEIEVAIGAAGDAWEANAASAGQLPEADRIIGRALAYVRSCTALRVGPDERAFLADHRILPLSWTRDAYWQALALLAADGPGDRSRVADHLRWLWRRCERPDARWARSHHANGRRKDLAFQADQQLYPILELCDSWRHQRRPAPRRRMGRIRAPDLVGRARRGRPAGGSGGEHRKRRRRPCQRSVHRRQPGAAVVRRRAPGRARRSRRT